MHARDIIQELGKLGRRVTPQIIEFFHQLFCALLADGQSLYRWRLILQEVAVVRHSQMHPHVCDKE